MEFFQRKILNKDLFMASTVLKKLKMLALQEFDNKALTI